MDEKTISTAEAKRRYKAQWGRDLRMGYEAPVQTYRYWGADHRYWEVRVYLIHEAGGYRLNEYISPAIER